jgi:gliding motility-associated-like protein
VKKLILLSIVAFAAGFSRVDAQILSAGADTSICPGQSITLTAAIINPGGGAVPAPINVSLCGGLTGGCDDSYSDSWIPIGFTFNFYGNNYTQCLIGTNGLITFSGATPGGYCQWPISANCPSNSNPVNSIFMPWQDNYVQRPPQLVRYKTIGNAPNRVFIVEFLDVGAYQCGTANCFGNQVFMREGSNIIETHILHKQVCGSWNSGRAIHGIQNSSGTIAHIVPGRNGLDAGWNINQAPFVAPPNSPGPEGRRWTPVSATNYTMAVIPFAPIYMPNTPPAPGSFSWSIAGGGTFATGTSISVSPATTTNYVVTIPYSGCGTALSFRDTVRVNMGVLPLTVSPTTTICYGDTADIFVHTIIPGTINYTWTPNTNIVNNTQDTIQAYPTATTTYTVTASNGGCNNTATVLVNVNPLPIPGVNPVNPQICQGSSVNMTASGGVSYVWSPGTGLNQTSGATVTAAPNVTTPYTIVVTDANGCVDSMVNTVNFFLNPTVSASSAAPGVCLNDDTQMQANGALNYVWSPSAGLSASNIANPVASPAQTTNYQVIGTDVNNCKDTANVTVLVYPNPVSAPLNVNLQDNSTISSGSIAGYYWSVEGMAPSVQQNPTYVFSNPGIFDVTLITVSDMGCTDTLTMLDYLNSYSIPTAGFYATPNPATLGDAMIQFTSTSSLDATSFFWNFDGLASVTGLDPQYEFSFADTFTVTLVVSTIHGCSDTTTGTVTVEDVSEIWIPNSFTPGNQDGLNDAWFPIGRNLLNDNVSIQVEIFDRWGTSVFSSTDALKPWLGKVSNTVNDCPQGVYVYKILFKNEKGKEFNYSGHVSLIR